MAYRHEKNAEETGRLIRIGTLSLGLLAPFINVIATRLREQAQAETAVSTLQKTGRERIKKALKGDLRGVTETTPATVNLDLQEKLQVLGATVSDVLADLRERGTSQIEARQGASFADDLKEQSERFSQVVAERGRQITQNIAEGSNQLSDNIAQQRKRLAKQWTKQSQQEREEQVRSFWIAFGFGIGIAAAGIVSYVLVKRRRQTLERGEQPIELPYANERVLHSVPNRQESEIVTIKGTGQPNAPVHTPRPVAIAEQSPEPSDKHKPEDAQLVGVTTSKLYYPIETPLDKLTDDERPVDVVYFSTEEEARTQGFSRAEA